VSGDGANFGRYRLLERLGKGGMAEAWRAELRGPEGFQRIVVVKKILPHFASDPNFVRGFIREAQVSGRLSHTNVIQVFDFGEVDGTYYLAMEWVQGRDLKQIVAGWPNGLPRPPGFAAYVAREACRALEYIHDLRDDEGPRLPLALIHRDVTPSNILVSLDGAVKLLDFGVAKALAGTTEQLTRTGVVKGKAGYASPELIEGIPLDHRTDLFSLGVVLHEALTGRRLFLGSSDLQTLELVRKAEIPLPSRLNPVVPAALDRICARALERDRDRRYGDAHQMRCELDAMVEALAWDRESTSAIARQLGSDVPPRAVVFQRQRPPRRTGRSRLLVASALGLAALAWRYGPLVGRGAREQAVPGPARPPAPSPVSGPALEPMVPTGTNAPWARLSLRSSPEGSIATIDGAERGSTPLVLTVPVSYRPYHVVVQHPGFQPRSIDVVVDRSRDVRVTLERLAATGARAKRPAPSSVDEPDTISHGAVVDPFAP
jgi:hypothetical protein